MVISNNAEAWEYVESFDTETPGHGDTENIYIRRVRIFLHLRVTPSPRQTVSLRFAVTHLPSFMWLQESINGFPG